MKLQIIAIGCFLSFFQQGPSSPIPDTLLVTVGSDVVLPCPAPGNGTVLWQFDVLTSPIPKEIFVDKTFYNGYFKRCQLTGSETSFNDLVIFNVSTNDAGGYICTMNNGIGRSQYIILKVSERNKKATALNPLSRLTSLTPETFFASTVEQGGKIGVSATTNRFVIATAVVSSVFFMIGLVAIAAICLCKKKVLSEKESSSTLLNART